MRTLRAIEPRLQRQAVKDIKLAAEPLRASVAGSLPQSAPLSGMDHAGRTGWKARGSAAVKTKYGGRRGRDRTSWPLVSIVLTGAAGSIYDMAGRASGGRTESGQELVSSLTSVGGAASRVVWPAVEARLTLIQAAVLKAVEEVSDQANVDLGKRPGGI
jgi:hypothetical protein